MSGTIATELQSLGPSALITLLQLDLTPDISPSPNIYYFHSGTNKLGGAIVWQGQSYAAWPLKVSGFDKSIRGALPRVSVTLGNQGSMMTLLALSFQDMLGAKLTRKRTFARFLDAINFAGDVNANADPTQELPDDVYYLERKVSENKLQIELEFTSQFDQEGVMLPRRQLIANMCPWVYRDSECSYAGIPVANETGTLLSQSSSATPPFSLWNSGTSYALGDAVVNTDIRRVFVCIIANTNNVPENDPTHWEEDQCGKQLSDCKLRPFSGAIFPFGGFPGVELVPN